MASAFAAAGTSCPHTGLSRPECSCPSCIRDLLDRYGPRDAKASASRQSFLRPLPQRLSNSPVAELSVAERLSLPAL